MKPIDALGFGPKRVVKLIGDGYYALVEVTPPRSMFPNAKTHSVRLTYTQFVGYKRWMAGESIQEALPGLSPRDHEILITGMPDV